MSPLAVVEALYGRGFTSLMLRRLIFLGRCHVMAPWWIAVRSGTPVLVELVALLGFLSVSGVNTSHRRHTH
jgi:hypothetical protein